MGKKSFVNFLTFVRAPLVLAGAVCALCHAWHASRLEWLMATFVLMGLSALTDLFDGMLARRWQVTSALGALADPLMDKVFYVVTLPVAVFLAMKNGDVGHAVVLLILTIVSLLRDQWVSFLRSIGVMYGADVKANWAGKLRTAVGFPIIVVIYLVLGVQAHGAWLKPSIWVVLLVFEVALILLTLLSAWIYTVEYRNFLKKAMQDRP